MKSFHDYLGLSNSCSYNVDDVIGRADRFGFQNFCSPDTDISVYCGIILPIRYTSMLNETTGISLYHSSPMFYTRTACLVQVVLRT